MNDLLKYSFVNLWKRKLRSSLTIISILIGITAIYALVSFGQGLQTYTEDFAKELGTDKILVQPKGFALAPGSGNVDFNQEDVDFIRKVRGVEETAGWQATSGKISFKEKQDKFVFVSGFPAGGSELRLVREMFAGIDVIDGRELKKGDALKATLGYNYLLDKKIFEKALKVGDKIEVNDIEVEVIGFYEEVGNPQDDANVYLTTQGFEEIFDTDRFFYIVARSAPGENPATVADRITDDLGNRRNQEEGQEDFTAQTFEETLATFTNIITIINAILIMIALISIIVASVNIANTMYTSILERTQEIGVMKAVGARNNIILFIFVAEAGTLGLVGGLFGVILGYLIASAGGAIAANAGLSLLKPIFPIWLTAGSLLFSFVIGAVSGYFPARQASKLKPVDALRYE